MIKSTNSTNKLLKIKKWVILEKVNPIVLLLPLFLFLFFYQSFAQIAPVNPPTGGFAIDGGLRANTPQTGIGDWYPGPTGSGGYVFNENGSAVNPLTSGRATPADPYNSGDNIFTNGSKFNDYVSALNWTTNSAPDKNDINNALYHISRDGSNNQWAFISGDRLSTNGTSYIDFEFLQGTITKNPNGTFTGSPVTTKPNGGGRTQNDMIISMEYTNGGSKPNVYVYQWKLTNGVWSYQSITPPANSAFAETNRNGAETNLPYTAFGSTTYQQYAFVEAAINITRLLEQTGQACAGLSIQTLWIKTKASASSTAALKDFVDPIPVDFEFGSTNFPQIGPFCVNNSTPQTLTATPSGGTFSGPGVSGNTFTPSIAGVGVHTIEYSYSGCSASIQITVNPNPTISGLSIGAICQGTSSASLTYSGVTGSANQYRIDWNTGGPADVAYTSLPASPITIPNTGSLQAGSYNGTIYVKNSTTGCESAGDPITLTVNDIPTITVTGIGAICQGTSSASLTYSGTTAGANQYRIDWDAGGPVDVAYTSLPNSPITISGTGALTAGTYNGTIYVKNTTTGCESTGAPVQLVINENPAITVTGIGAICFGSTSAALSYSSVSGGADQYKIDWDAGGPADITSYIALPNSPITIPNTGSLQAGSYNGTIYVKNSSTGCESAGAPITLVVNENPTITVTGIGAICQGASSASLSYSNVTAGANQYRIDWNAGGPADVAYTALPASPITISGTGALTAGTYNGTIYVKNTTTGCESAGDPISLTVNEIPGPPDVTYIAPPSCTDPNFTVRVNSPVMVNATYTLKKGDGTYVTEYKPANTNTFTFSVGIPAGAGFIVTVETESGCSTEPYECGVTENQVTSVQNDQSKVQSTETAKSQVQSGNQKIETVNAKIGPSQTKVLAAPNPYESKIRFNLESAVSGQGSLEIYNTLGQKIATVYQGYIEKGQVKMVEFNVPDAQRANLIYVFKVGDQRVTGKLINLRF